MDLGVAISRLRSFLAAGQSYENRGGKHDPLDDDIEAALDMIEWISDPEAAEKDEIERHSHSVTMEVASSLEAQEGDGPLEQDMRLVGAYLRSNGY